MSTTINLAVDSGKHSTKASVLSTNGSIRHDTIRTKMDVGVDSMSLGIQNRTFDVEYEGEKYLLGEQATTISADTQKSELIHKIATYVAIAQNVGNGDHVNLAIGCPLSVFINKDAKLRYKDFIAKPGSQINIKVNGKNKMFVIDRSFVFAETSGVIYLNREKYLEQTVGVVDIGGLNANCCVYKFTVPQPEVAFTLKAGGNILTKKIMTALESACLDGEQISEQMYDQIMKDGKLINNDESAQVIMQQKQAHIKQIYDECLKHRWSLRIMPVVFTGGTSKYLIDEIKAKFPIVDLDNIDDETAFKNADGFLYQMLDRMGIGH